MPRGIPKSKEISSHDVTPNQGPALEMPVSGPLSEMLRPDLDIKVADGQSLGDYAAQLAFNEEMIDVVVHESTDKNAEPIVDVYCNGTPQRFLRGQTQKVRRKYVEILARAKQTSISTETNVYGGNNGEPVNRINRHTAVRYPFSVVYDPNPKGATWLKQALAG